MDKKIKYAYHSGHARAIAKKHSVKTVDSEPRKCRNSMFTSWMEISRIAIP